jgi:uncharacterized protein (DUF2141 family)
LTVFNNVTNNEDSANNFKVLVVIEGVRSKKGKLVITIFKDQESFEKRTPIKKVVLNKSKIKGNVIVFTISLGTYGISVLDDGNDNNIIDYNFFGMPKEGFAFSNYFHKGLSKPYYDSFQFEIIDGMIKKFDILLSDM